MTGGKILNNLFNIIFDGIRKFLEPNIILLSSTIDLIVRFLYYTVPNL